MRLQIVPRRGVRALWVVFAVLVVLVVYPAPAAACPSCPTARQVNAIVCGEGMWRNLAITVAPFVVFAAICWFLHLSGNRPRQRRPARPLVGRRDTLAKLEETT